MFGLEGSKVVGAHLDGAGREVEPILRIEDAVSLLVEFLTCGQELESGLLGFGRAADPVKAGGREAQGRCIVAKGECEDVLVGKCFDKAEPPALSIGIE